MACGTMPTRTTYSRHYSSQSTGPHAHYLQRETLAEFEEQLKWQQECAKADGDAEKVGTKRTRVDDDGVVMEWDESKRAWFPKVHIYF